MKQPSTGDWQRPGFIVRKRCTFEKIKYALRESCILFNLLLITDRVNWAKISISV